jgi:hypothetical protein
MDLLDRFGIDPRSNQIFWDGEKLVTERRLADFERGLAVAGLLIAAIAALSGLATAIIEVGRVWFGLP